MPFRLLYLLLVLLLTASPLLAQTSPAAAPAAPPAAAPVPDTVAALHRLFAAKRKMNSFFFAGTLVLGGIVASTEPSGLKGLELAVPGVTIVALATVPALVIEAVTALDYTKKHEQQAVADFEAHKLPPYLKRKLKPRYFR